MDLSILDLSYQEMQQLIYKWMDEVDELLYPEIGDTKEYNMDNDVNIKLLVKYPHILMVEEESPSETPSISNITEKPVENKPVDIWEMIDDMQAESTENTTKTKNTCSMCGGTNIVEDTTYCQMVCHDCGSVDDVILNQGPEWRSYFGDGKSDNSNRCGCPSNYFFPKSMEGTIMGGSTNSVLKRKQGWNPMIYKEKNLNEMFELIGKMCKSCNIPNIIADDAKIYYKTFSECKYNSGKNKGKTIIKRSGNRKAIIIACILKACEKNAMPHSIDEVSQYVDVSKKNITKGCKQLNSILKFNRLWVAANRYTSIDITVHYIMRYCKTLNIDKEHIDIASTIARNGCMMKIAPEHNPRSVAAGATLAMVTHCHLKIDKLELSKAFDISQVTIGKIHNKIIPYIEVLVDTNMTKYMIKRFKING